MKAKQAELITKYVCKGKDDRSYHGTYQHELSKVRKLEYFARDLSKSMCELPSNNRLEMELRIDYLDITMKDKPYKAYKSQFKNWSLEDLKEEVNRIEMMKNNPQMKKSAPKWNKHKKVDVDEALRYKRKRSELVAAGYRTAKSIARWSKQDVDLIKKVRRA
ncbi:hypothetical protein Hanom_Chr05g00413511 [Helianthus anomalus]